MRSVLLRCENVLLSTNDFAQTCVLAFGKCRLRHRTSTYQRIHRFATQARWSSAAEVYQYRINEFGAHQRLRVLTSDRSAVWIEIIYSASE